MYVSKYQCGDSTLKWLLVPEDFISFVRVEVFTAVTMSSASSRMLRHVALIKTDVSEERSSFIIRVTRIGELGTTLAIATTRRTLRRNSHAA
jgi:hypothetical protein